MKSEIAGIVKDLGRGMASVMYPNDIEYYAVSVDLVDSLGNTVEYLTFPVNPDMFQYDDTPLTTIRKTMGGVTALNSSTFVPKSITMSGSFGRAFKLLLSPPTDTNMTGVDVQLSHDNGLSAKSSILDARLKSGYGAIKLLQKILEQSRTLDDRNLPYRMFLYLPLIGHNFLVEYENLVLRQDFSSGNMIWKYNLHLTAIAPLSETRTRGFSPDAIGKMVGIKVFQKSINSIAGKIRRMI